MQDRALAARDARSSRRPTATVQVVWSGASTSFVAARSRTVTPKVRGAHRRAAGRGDALPRGVDPGAARQPARGGRPRPLGDRSSPAGCRRRCVPSHCEVLRLKGTGPIPSTTTLHLIEVGRATLKPDAPFAPFVLPTPPTELVARAVRYHTPQPSPVVIANGVAGALAARPSSRRSTARTRWFVPIGRGDVHPWAIGAFQRQGAPADREIEAELRRVPGDRADRHARDGGVLLAASPRAGCSCSAARAARSCSRSRSSRRRRCAATSPTRAGA